ncbi:putative helicase, P-loop containing nucleoside triphosphate hydrolase [Septoria linicola]|nr:putative helicase, P-loop containing nucleoside triphosphate hydrolase [Septoria linicola]
MASDDNEFDLSSGDEADLLGLDENTAPSTKRKREEDNADPLKRARSAEQPSASAIEVANQVVNEHFKIPSFRLKQEAAIARLLDGKSAVVVFPTGGGKSLCYQVPALCFKEMDRRAGIRQGYAEGGITLVVSPLIALMKDQVDALHRKGISAAVLDSTKSKEEYLQTVDAMRNGTLDILYCAPERLNNEGFVSSMANVKGGVRLLAVDEAHCISEWGHAFRPDYLKVARFAREIQAERVVCLTATATPTVAADVCKAFDIDQHGLFRTSTYRSNLKLKAMSFQTKNESYPVLESLLKKHPGSTIIYVTTQKQTEELAVRLRQRKFKAEAFHAGMKAEDKTAIQEKFMASSELIIVATIAFGMGIDKADIRNVFHYDIPRSLEGYSQEIGRAGRDGLDSQCVLFLCAEDLHLRESFARGDLPSKSSVFALLQSIFSITASKDPQPTIEASSYTLSKEFDIKMTTLGNIYAQLELQFGLLRATTPKYTKYRYKIKQSTARDKTPAANAIHASARTAKTWTDIDVEVAARKSGVPRADVVRKLNNWNDNRLIELEPSGVINVFRVMKGWPPSPAEARRLTDALYKDLELREQQDLGRMKQVMDLITGDTCFARVLTTHFGDTLPDNAQECGHCTWCETKASVPKVSMPKKFWDPAAFDKILDVVEARDDPRYLARIAFGIHSPRVTVDKLGKSPVFGSMEDHDFVTLLKAFEKVCDEWENE